MSTRLTAVIINSFFVKVNKMDVHNHHRFFNSLILKLEQYVTTGWRPPFHDWNIFPSIYANLCKSFQRCIVSPPVVCFGKCQSYVNILGNVISRWSLGVKPINSNWIHQPNCSWIHSKKKKIVFDRVHQLNCSLKTRWRSMDGFDQCGFQKSKLVGWSCLIKCCWLWANVLRFLCT